MGFHNCRGLDSVVICHIPITWSKTSSKLPERGCLPERKRQIRCTETPSPHSPNNCMRYLLRTSRWCSRDIRWAPASRSDLAEPGHTKYSTSTKKERRNKQEKKWVMARFLLQRPFQFRLAPLPLPFRGHVFPHSQPGRGTGLQAEGGKVNTASGRMGRKINTPSTSRCTWACRSSRRNVIIQIHPAQAVTGLAV